jgi:hypothetical protein
MSFRSWIDKRFRGHSSDRLIAGSENSAETHDSTSAGSNEDAGDSPLVSDATAREDLFNRLPFANRLAEMIAMHNDHDSIVFGLYGEWGSGKTTVLELTESVLKKRYADRVVTIRFNPWRFHDETLILTTFMRRLFEAIEKSPTTAGVQFTTFVRDHIAPSIPGFEVGGAKLNIAEAVGRYADILSRVDLESMRDRLGEFLVQSKVRVTIFLDDIDRLDHAEIQTVFRLVKLTADFKNTAYVLAFDEVLAAKALAPRYGLGTESGVGGSFLEKIVQVPLRIPKISQQRLLNYCFREVNRVLSMLQIQLTDDEAERFGYYFSASCELRLTTPRAAKRFANLLAFTLPTVQGEVNLVDFMLIEALHFFYPDVYKLIRDHPQIALNKATYITMTQEDRGKVGRDAMEAVLSPLSSEDQERVKQVLHKLFPQMQGLSKNVSYGSEWESEWERGMHVASSRYFDRYFAYGVGTDEISEREIAEVFDIVVSGNVDAIGDAVLRLLTERDQDEGVYAIQRISQLLNGNPAAWLAQVLGRCGPILRDSGRYGFGLTPRDIAAQTIINLLSRVTDSADRMMIAESIVQNAAPLVFALEIVIWMGGDRDANTSSGVTQFRSEEIATLRGIVASRIDNRGIRNILDDCEANDGRQILWGWREFGDINTLSTSLAKLIAEDNAYAIRLIKCLVPVPINTNIRRKSDFTSDHYKTLSELIDPQVVYATLQQQFGEAVESPVYDRNDPDVDRRLARQFAYLHMNPENTQDRSAPLPADDVNNE